MTRASARAHIAVMLGVLAFAAGAWPRAQVVQQPPPPPPTGPQPVVGTGFISGQVIELPSGRPVPDVLIQLTGRGAAPPPGMRGGGVPPQVVVTDSQGRFFFSRLPNGIYTPRAVKSGYESRSIVTVEVGDAERVTDVKLRIAPLAAISGAVRDVGGDPVVGTTMFAFRRGIVNGKPGWQQSGRAVTDDRGAYRLSGLTAGDYLVCACARDPIPFDGQLLTTIAAEPIGLLAVAARALAVGADAVSLDNTVKTHAPRFHPDAASAARATKIPSFQVTTRPAWTSLLTWFAPRVCRDGSSALRVRCRRRPCVCCPRSTQRAASTSRRFRRCWFKLTVASTSHRCRLARTN